MELLLSAGADPSVKNDLGKDAVDFCSSFPELRGVLQKRHRKLAFRDTKRVIVLKSLAKRISTATPIHHDMWLMSLDTMLGLYSSDTKKCIVDVHQKLKRLGLLVNWRDIRSDSEVVFVSHEWLSWAHPDPKGEHMKILCRVLRRLKEGKVDTEMDPFHTIFYKHKFKTKAKDWMEMMNRTYIWFDWFSMPQPGAERVADIGEKKMDVLRADGSRAIRSIPAYVERSDFILILVPSLYHSDRKVPTCYRTWRRRGWCLLELYAAAMARDASNPPLLVRSERGTPTWISPLEIQKLSIGMADFTCCQRNHVITTETQKVMNGGEVKKIPCDKPIAASILEQLIEAKANYLFNEVGDFVLGRWYTVMKQWWMRTLQKRNESMNILKFKRRLRWSQSVSDEYFDCVGTSLLCYAVMGDEVDVVRELLVNIRRDFQGKNFEDMLNSRLRKEGFITLGVAGEATALMGAMGFASSEMVTLLLENGANVHCVDVMGSDAFMFGCAFARKKNVECFLRYHPTWHMEKQNTILGGYALANALYMGPNNLETVQFLLDFGARTNMKTSTGGTVLTTIVENEDSDPETLRLILRRLRSSTMTDTNFLRELNYRREPQTMKWRVVYFAAKSAFRFGTSSCLLQKLAIEAGGTPLNSAILRGDVEIVKILLEHGADPYMENHLQMNAFRINECCGPFPKIEQVLHSFIR